MDALVMCGGRGTRLEAPVEKPLLEVCAEPMVDAVLSALAESATDRTYAAVSPHAPETADHLRDHPVEPTLLETPGAGYVADLRTALETATPPVLSVVADLPLLESAHVDQAVRASGAGANPGAVSTVICVPAALKRELDVSVDTTVRSDGRELAPTGMNVIADQGDQRIEAVNDTRLAVNVNRPGDVDVAEGLCN